MQDRIEIMPTGPVFGSIRPPGSKSITNRALVCAALAHGVSVLDGALASEDTRVMIDSLGRLGVGVIPWAGGTRIAVVGCGGKLSPKDAELDIANSGTTVRFLTAVAALGHGTTRLHGTQRMHERPIEDLLDALRQMGSDAQSENDTLCPPVVVRGNGLAGGQATIRSDISSQFLSAILMVAPYCEQSLELTVSGQLVSVPYVRMTLAVMKAFGVDLDDGDLSRFVFEPGREYQSRLHYAIEPDASAASYFFGAAAMTGGRVTVEGLSRNSLQGDVAFCDCLEKMGCEVRWDANCITVTGKPLHGIEVDMNAISDTVQTLAAVALLADGPTTITGVAHIRHKETDRIGALATELRKLGAKVDERADSLCITPGKLQPAEIETYDDHRMAMSLALVGLVQPGVVIKDPGCTRKTYPKFFQDLERLGV